MRRQGTSHYTSPGGRVFAFVFGALLLVMTAASIYWAVRIIGDGRASVSVGRGASRGKIGLSGWKAYVYAAGVLCGATWFGLSAAGLLLGAFTRHDAVAVIALRLLHLGRYAMLAAAALCMTAVVGKVFF